MFTTNRQKLIAHLLTLIENDTEGQIHYYCDTQLSSILERIEEINSSDDELGNSISLKFLYEVRKQQEFSEEEIERLYGYEPADVSDDEEWAIWYTPAEAAKEYRKYRDNGWSHEDAIDGMGEDAYLYSLTA